MLLNNMYSDDPLPKKPDEIKFKIMSSLDLKTGIVHRRSIE
jgi:hypothetical protein